MAENPGKIQPYDKWTVDHIETICSRSPQLLGSVVALASSIAGTSTAWITLTDPRGSKVIASKGQPPSPDLVNPNYTEQFLIQIDNSHEVGAICVYDEVKFKLNSQQNDSLCLLAEQLSQYIILNDQRQAEEACQQALIQDMQEVAHIGGWEWVAQSDTLAVSQNFCDLLEFPENGKVLLSDFSNRLAGPHSDKLVDYLTIALRSHKDHELELEVDLNDGSCRWVRLVARRVQKDDNQQPVLRGYIQDITSRKASDKEIQDLQERYRLSLLASGLGVWEWNVDEDNLIWDRRTTQLFTDKYRDTVIPIEQALSLASDEDRKTFREILSNLRHGMSNVQTEIDVLLPTGKTRPLRIFAEKFDDDRNEGFRVIGGAMDISDERAQLAAIQDINERFDLTIKSASVGIWDWYDIDGHKAWWSPQTFSLLGYKPDEIPPTLKTIMQLLHPDDLKPVGKVFKEHLSNEKPFIVTCRLKCKNGQYKWFRGTGKAVFDENGQPRRMVGALADIHEVTLSREQLKLAVAEAERANQVKSDFLSNMSHEIRTPLNAIIGFSQVLLEDPDAEDRKYMVETIKSSGDTLMEIINNILDIMKIEAGELSLENIEFDLEDVIEQTLEMLSVAAAHNDVQLNLDLHPNTPTQVFGDPLRVRQILVNLVGNAIKFTHHGYVSVIVRPDVAVVNNSINISLQVADTGVGISEDKLGSIFGNFTQVDTSTTRVYGGSGLGLSIVQQLTEKMGGEVNVTSELNKGSKFTVNIPFQFNPHWHLMRPNYDRSFKNMNLWVVDSSPFALASRERLFQDMGAQVQAANTIDQLLDSPDQKAPDLIIFEARTPEDFVEFDRRIATSPMGITDDLVLFIRQNLTLRSVRHELLDVYKKKLESPVRLHRLVQEVRRLTVSHPHIQSLVIYDHPQKAQELKSKLESNHFDVTFVSRSAQWMDALSSESPQVVFYEADGNLRSNTDSVAEHLKCCYTSLPVIQLENGPATEPSSTTTDAPWVSMPMTATGEDFLEVAHDLLGVSPALRAGTITAPSNVNRLSILVAEDSVKNQELLSLYFRDLPYSLTFVDNGQDAITAAKQSEFDLIFMDIQMPIVDGYQATEAIKDWEQRQFGEARTPIIALTAAAMDEDKNRAFQAGVDAHISKPVSKAALLKIIKTFEKAEKLAG